MGRSVGALFMVAGGMSPRCLIAYSVQASLLRRNIDQGESLRICQGRIAMGGAASPAHYNGKAGHYSERWRRGRARKWRRSVVLYLCREASGFCFFVVLRRLEKGRRSPGLCRG
ncbi:unnamed protein product [Amoebophrya sp. A120]|nr:unnamed protein product [Amoebophrya sp. A120]|eukprot:GSA120T00018298001.1